ncbi:MAG: hypothetical protein R3266_07595 [Gemmatimonadota bacterium]|nr:hypothetical protein [Gemmatimonadota bacterium]
MYLELAEALDCPECRSAVGLVAFVEEAEGRRVLRGWLGCPLCEVEYPIVEGAIRFGGGGPAAPSRDDAAHSDEQEVALRLGALLGLAERRGVVVLLGPGLGRLGPRVARFAERAEVIAWLSGEDGDRLSFDLADLEAGVDPIVGAAPAAWPVRERSLDGVALQAGTAVDLDEAGRCLKSGGRLVLTARGDEAPRPSAGEERFREIAGDARAWVGERL